MSIFYLGALLVALVTAVVERHWTAGALLAGAVAVRLGVHVLSPRPGAHLMPLRARPATK